MAIEHLQDFYQLTLLYTYLGQECQNVFHLRRLTVGALAYDAGLALAATVNTYLLPLWSIAVQVTGIKTFNLALVNDFQDWDWDPVGEVTGQYCPAYCSYALSFRRLRRDMPHGYKRFSGVPEASQYNGQVLSGYLTLLRELGAALLAPIVRVEAGTAFEYVIVKRVPYVAPSGKVAYRLPENDDELVYYHPLTCAAARGIRNQTSRQALRI